MNALRIHYEKQDEARRFQLSQMEVIIQQQQQSEQIRALTTPNRIHEYADEKVDGLR